MATGDLSRSLLIDSEDGYTVRADPAAKPWSANAPDGVGQGPLTLRQRITPVWESALPYPRRRELTMWYTFGSIGLGLTFGAQGPVALPMAEQCGFVRVIGQLNGSDSEGAPCGGSICTGLDLHGELVSCGDSLPVQQVGCDVLDTSQLDLLGVATGFDALAGLVGCSLGAFLGSTVKPWHLVHVSCMVWTGLAFIAWTTVGGFWSMLTAAALWGFLSVVPNLLTQPALTWIWADDVAPWMSVFHAGFGLGSLVSLSLARALSLSLSLFVSLSPFDCGAEQVAPVIVSLDLDYTGSFHHSYFIIGMFNIMICIPVLLLPSPQPRVDATATNGEQQHAVVEQPADQQQTMYHVALSAPTKAPKAPSAWRRMFTGAESQASAGGDWRLWLCWYSCFFWYAAFEIGFSAWISPYATLLGLVEDESKAALLTTCYYVPFTLTRAYSDSE
eukprot:COSAG03_NODE_4027_length_1714_cov_1.825387_1_plen_445_part_00